MVFGCPNFVERHQPGGKEEYLVAVPRLLTCADLGLGVAAVRTSIQCMSLEAGKAAWKMVHFYIVPWDSGDCHVCLVSQGQVNWNVMQREKADLKTTSSCVESVSYRMDGDGERIVVGVGVNLMARDEPGLGQSEPGCGD